MFKTFSKHLKPSLRKIKYPVHASLIWGCSLLLFCVFGLFVWNKRVLSELKRWSSHIGRWWPNTFNSIKQNWTEEIKIILTIFSAEHIQCIPFHYSILIAIKCWSCPFYEILKHPFWLYEMVHLKIIIALNCYIKRFQIHCNSN